MINVLKYLRLTIIKFFSTAYDHFQSFIISRKFVKVSDDKVLCFTNIQYHLRQSHPEYLNSNTASNKNLLPPFQSPIGYRELSSLCSLILRDVYQGSILSSIKSLWNRRIHHRNPCLSNVIVLFCFYVCEKFYFESLFFLHSYFQTNIKTRFSYM